MRNLILSLDNGGQPHQWITWQDAITLKCKGLIAWEFGDEEFMFKGGYSRISGLQSSIEVASIIALKTKFAYKRRTPTLTNRNLFRRDLNVCAYCGDKFHDKELTKDHIHPVSRGGPTTWQNCVTACTHCNNKKDSKTLDEARMQLLYVPYVPDRSEGLILANRNILYDQAQFLLAFIPKHSRVHSMIG